MTSISIGREADARASIALRIKERFDIAETGAELSAYEVDWVVPAAVLHPDSAVAVAEMLSYAAAERLAAIACGGRSKLGIGAPPTRYDVALDLSRMNRILAYEPRDLTLGVEPGVRFADLAKTLAAERQFLPLAPPFGGRATIGGILAADSASPLRYGFGGPRDFNLGMEFVTGTGAIAKSGGRVVKNVSGYDLHKALIGSLGTLGVITRANFKTFPIPPSQGMIVATFESAAAAMEYCGSVRRSALGPQLVEVVSPEAGRVLTAGADASIAIPDRSWSVVISAAGGERVVERHARDLRELAGHAKAREFSSLSEGGAAKLLESLCEFPALVTKVNTQSVLFRIAAVPTGMAALSERLTGVAGENGIPSMTLLRPHGIIYFALMPAEGTPAGRLTGVAAGVFFVTDELGAKAKIEFAPVELKRSVNVWGAGRPDFELMRRVKSIFDPEGIMSPGRFAGGI